MEILIFAFNLILFLFASLTCFTLPGLLILKKSDISFSFLENVFLATVVGFTFYTLLSYLLLVLKIPFLILPLVLILDFFILKHFSLKQKISPTLSKKILFLLLIFVIGVAGQLLIIAPSGLKINGDLVFWSSHAHDGSWHLALMEELKKGYPLQNPVLAGEKLINYHFFSDISPTDFNKYFKIPELDLYFRFFPLIFSILLGGLSFILGSRIGGNYASGLWAVIFTYFVGSFGYIVTYIQNKTIGGESLFWVSQIQSSSGNPPQIISSVIILAFLIFFLQFCKDKKGFIICLMLGGSLIVFKVYAGAIILASLGIVGLWQIIKERRMQVILLFILSSILSALLYLPNTLGSTHFLIWEPWWFIRTMIVAPDRLNWIDLELRRQTYIAEGNFKRVVQLELTGFLIFTFGNLGMRFLGLWYFVKNIKNIFHNYFYLLFFLIITISFITPLLFLQKGVAGNTIQFFQYVILLLGITAGITTAKILNKLNFIPIKIILALLIILLSIPTQVSLVYGFNNRAPIAKISSQELEALNFLKTQTPIESIILTAPYNKYYDGKTSIPDIWDWFDTGYVTAFSSRRTYFSDAEQVDIMGYNIKDRSPLQEEVFNKTEDANELVNKLKTTNANYLYFPLALKPKVDLSKTNLEKVFSNSAVEIWKIN